MPGILLPAAFLMSLCIRLNTIALFCRHLFCRTTQVLHTFQRGSGRTGSTMGKRPLLGSQVFVTTILAPLQLSLGLSPQALILHLCFSQSLASPSLIVKAFPVPWPLMWSLAPPITIYGDLVLADAFWVLASLKGDGVLCAVTVRPCSRSIVGGKC